MTDLVVFDMDGTLVDSLADIGESMNHVLRENGHPDHPIAAYRTMVGEGARQLVERALPKGAEASHVDQVLAAYRKRYTANLVVHTKPYEGILELLEELKGRGMMLGILTNKPHAAAVAIANKLFPEGTFDDVRGQQDGVPLKPDPTAAWRIASSLGIDPPRCAFVGDTDVDMQTATRAAMTAIGVLWGFRERPELEAHGAKFIATQPMDIADFTDRG